MYHTTTTRTKMLDPFLELHMYIPMYVHVPYPNEVFTVQIYLYHFLWAERLLN